VTTIFARGTASAHFAVLTSTVNPPGTLTKRFAGSGAPARFWALALITIQTALGATERSDCDFPGNIMARELAAPGANETSTFGLPVVPYRHAPPNCVFGSAVVWVIGEWTAAPACPFVNRAHGCRLKYPTGCLEGAAMAAPGQRDSPMAQLDSALSIATPKPDRRTRGRTAEHCLSNKGLEGLPRTPSSWDEAFRTKRLGATPDPFAQVPRRRRA
jgi:hypothetical protein